MGLRDPRVLQGTITQSHDAPIPDVHHDDDQLLEDRLPVNWRFQCEQITLKVPLRFIDAIVTWWIGTEDTGTAFRTLSEVELVFAFLTQEDFSFPFWIEDTGTWIFRTPVNMFQKPTFADLLRVVQLALKGLLMAFPALGLYRPPSADHGIGVYKLFRGVRLKISDVLYREIRARASQFTCRRPRRRCCDLARPAN